MPVMGEICFTINGQPFQVSPETVTIHTTLNTFIRTKAHLSGTKFMCLEGGCGACIVTVKGIHPVTKKQKSWAVNSCLTPILSCHGLDIITVEGIGNRKDGYHRVQKRLAHMNGTQCGYCSPGMVMNMYSLLEANDGKVSMEQVENSFGGNICRCTGYRPILDAFKSLATDADQKLIDACKDIEDLNKTCPKTGNRCSGTCNNFSQKPIKFVYENEMKWHKVFNLDELFDAIKEAKHNCYMLVAGNTAHGVYRRCEELKTFIDITSVKELQCHSIDKEVCIGGNVNLTELMAILTAASTKCGFEYLKHLVHHIDLIANVPVRNAGTIAGNLSIKHKYIEFPSDLFVIFDSVGAKLTIAESIKKKIIVSLTDYLKTDMHKKIILNITLPALDPSVFKYRSYKIMPRAQNAHAYVNAGFLIELKNNHIISARICYGGIEPKFTHAIKTENILKGKELYNNDILQTAIQALNSELHPDWVLPDVSNDYRKKLAISLFYKFVINTSSENKVKPEYLTGGPILSRHLSTGKQLFDTYKDKWPLNKPVPKYEGLIQCSGEVQYVNDMPNQPNELWAAFVSATVVHAKVLNIDATNALKIPGVHHFFSAKDIPGTNNFYMPDQMFPSTDEEIFVGVDSKVLFNGQPVGVILADTFDLANFAAKKVKISYKRSDRKILPTLHDIHEQKQTDRYQNTPFNMTSTTSGNNATKKITGKYEIGSQYHFTMETQTSVCTPAEDGINVYLASQWIDFAQRAVAATLKIPNNSVNIVFTKIGGGYGAKITRAPQIACACALACYLTNRPVRFVMTLESNMDIIGKRYSLINEYEVDVDDNGKIQKLNNKYAQDSGCSLNDAVQFHTTGFFKNCYIHDSWNVISQFVTSDSPSNTYCRSPGTTEGIAMIENIMEHIARVTGKDPLAVRMANIPDDNNIKKLLPNFLKQTDFYERKLQIEEFNKHNRWRKLGIAISPMEYEQSYFGGITAYVAVYHDDGTVVVTHGGIECGQGINTKAAQVAAHVLNIPLEFIKIKNCTNVIGANSSATGGSMTSEAVCFAIKKSCEEILARIKPIRVELPGAEWKEIIKAAFNKSIDLTAKYFYTASDLKGYTIWGLSCAEVEVDLLTGSLQIKRVDILEDTGESLSTNVDIGQIEGAFVMGLGYWLTESIVYDQTNGELLTNRSWTYKPPGAKDIPIDFRIQLLQNSANEAGVLRSKATGEPPLCMSIVAVFALRHALDSARKDAGILEKWYNLGTPATPDVVFLNAGNDIKNFKLY